MKILLVSSYLPYPLFSGGHVRLFNILKELSKRHKVTLVCEKRAYQTRDDIQAVKRFCQEVITVDRKKQWSVSNMLKASLSNLPFLLVGHTNKQMRQKIEEVLKKESFDLIHVETFYVMQNLPKTSIPIVLVEHNIEYLVYKRYVEQLSIFLRILLMLDIVKLKKWESYYWQKATKLVAVSEQEKMLMQRRDVIVVLNGVDVQRFKVKSSKLKVHGEEKRVLFIGDFKWVQNRDAVFWLLKDIWPKVSSRLALKLWIVGRSIPRSIKQLTLDKNVLFDENAPKETSEIFAKSDILIAPIRVGGGTSFKILEAMASGVPVLTTPLGIEGIDAIDKKEVLLAETTDQFLDAIVAYFSNETAYETMTKNARALIEEKYNWSKIVLKLEGVYQSVVE